MCLSLKSIITGPRKIELGKDQILWLNKYRTINLEQWICDLIDKKPEWLYVGDWSPGPIKPYGKCDGGYAQRHRNLKSNRYFYWPRGEEEEESLKRDREEREAQLVEHERLMREKQEQKERAKEERRAQQLLRTRESQMNYYQNRVKKEVECKRCKKIYASAGYLKRHSLICKF